MTLTLELTPEQERRLIREANERGQDTHTYALIRLLGEAPKPQTEISPERDRQIEAAKALCGKYAHLPGSVDDFIAEKRREMEREDRF